MKISPRNRLILTIAAAALIVLALIALLVYPQLQQLRALNAQVVEATAQADAAKLQLDERRGFKDRAIETNAKWLRLMNQVPDTPDLASLIIELQDTAFDSGVQVISVTPAVPQPAVAFQSIPISVEVLGSWADTVDYTQALMKLDRGVRVLTFNVKVTSAAATTDVRNASLPPYAVDSVIGMEAYMIPSATATTTAAPAAPAQ
jgi:Tfp pilus assembly protein PilO